MAKNVIVVKGDREAQTIECQMASGVVAYPGMGISLKADNTWELWNGAATGERDEVAIVVEDDLVGQLPEEAYAAGARVRAYIPQRGDELNILVKSAANITRADKLIAEDASGLWIETTGTPEAEPFKALESPGALAANALVLCRFIG